jgi:leucyl aminopeptidase (aminopeptidase T)
MKTQDSNYRKYVEGAITLLNSLEQARKEGLTILYTQSAVDFAHYVAVAADELGFSNILNVMIPDAHRPITQIPALLERVVENSKGLVYLVDRRSEENFTFNRPLQDLCVRNKCRYIYVYDPKSDYLEQGIAADYEEVARKAMKIREILERSDEVRVTSRLGTDLVFKLHKEAIIPRNPLFNTGLYWNQAPEGEVMSCPLESTFNGKLVVDGVVTGLGQPPGPITWDFRDGVVEKVDGDRHFLEGLLAMLRKSDSRLESLLGMWIAELSVGCNDWAVFDDNISNCEKVSGGVHFAMGNSEGLGVDRGETYHFDNIVTAPSISITLTDGEKVQLIDDGRLLV